MKMLGSSHIHGILRLLGILDGLVVDNMLGMELLSLCFYHQSCFFHKMLVVHHFEVMSRDMDLLLCLFQLEEFRWVLAM